MKKIAVLIMAFVLFTTLTFPAVAYLLDPLRGRPKVTWLRACRLASIPPDGTPRLSPVRLARQDAWTHQSDETVGEVFLRRAPETGKVIALATRHSQYRMHVLYDGEKRLFRSACWAVEFDLDGKLQNQPGVTEDIESIEVKIEDDDVFVRWFR